MELTPNQHRAARACGFTFFPATEAQVQRLTMQRRIFRIDGLPCMATRDGAYWETHGTLLRLVDEEARGGEDPVGGPPARASLPQEPCVGDAAPTAEAQDGADTPGPIATPREEEARAPARNTRRRRAPAEPSARRDGEGTASHGAGALVRGPTAVDAPEVPKVPGEVRAEAVEGQPGPAALRARRARQPKVPRWTTAGKERRGRLQ